MYGLSGSKINNPLSERISVDQHTIIVGNSLAGLLNTLLVTTIALSHLYRTRAAKTCRTASAFNGRFAHLDQLHLISFIT